jgi:ATP-dependent RNA circularization protein (DNA/RNA ligase family)
VAINPAMELIKKVKRDKELSEKIKIIVERKDVIYKITADVKVM